MIPTIESRTSESRTRNSTWQRLPPNRSQLPPDLERLAELMDSVFHIPGLGLRFGFDSLIGLIPGLGDMLTSLVSLYILRVASSYGVPRVTMLRMTFNIAIDTIVGAIPLVGDAFDLYWKANLKNVALLRRHLDQDEAARKRSARNDGLFVLLMSMLVIALVAGSGFVVYWLLYAAWQAVAQG